MIDEFLYINSNSLKPADDYTSCEINKPVKLRVTENGLSSISPITIPEAFNNCMRNYSQNIALKYKIVGSDDDNWHAITYKEYYEKVIKISKAFIKIGLESRNSVAVLAGNCPEWFYSELAALFINCIITGIYATNSPEAVYHVLHTSNAKICIVDDSVQMDKVRLVQHRLPQLKAIVQINKPYSIHSEESYCNGVRYFTWTELEELVSDNEVEYLNDELKKRLSSVSANECCSLIYTSGTSGLPKAVMLSHDSMLMKAREMISLCPNFQYGNEVTVSFLPLNHVAAQFFDIFMPLISGSCVYFADRDAMKGSLLTTIEEARPTWMFGVPRVWEKLQEKISLNDLHEFKFLNAFKNSMRNIALNYHLRNLNEENINGKFNFSYYFAQKYLNYFKSFYGLERLKYFFSGGAPTAIETKKFFLSIDMILGECYGLTETSGGITLTNPNIINFDTVGKCPDGMQLKIVSPNEMNCGEICIKGRTVFMGYMNQPEKTHECLDADGWLYTGDQGHVDNNGNLYITGRIKEIVVTAGGENIPPANVENLIKVELPCISNAFLVGDCRKYLTVLLTIKTEMNPHTGEPLDKLHEETIDWLKNLNLKYEHLSEIHNSGPCPVILSHIDNGIKRANLNAVSNAQKVQKFRLLPHDFSVVTGELGPTLKVRRSIVNEKYSDLIDEMYK